MYSTKTVELNQVLKNSIDDSYSSEDHKKFNRIEKKFTDANLARLRTKLEKFRREGADMSSIALAGEDPAYTLIGEKHSSKLLGQFLRSQFFPRPGLNWEAHHIVSGKHKEARPARALLAGEEIKMRIDDPVNGCWMPKTKKDARPTIYPNAVPHCRIHREKYYDWIFNMLMNAETVGQAKAILLMVRAQLLDGNIKHELLLREIDTLEYDNWLKNKA